VKRYTAAPAEIDGMDDPPTKAVTSGPGNASTNTATGSGNITHTERPVADPSRPPSVAKCRAGSLALPG
jgi:hypothetical protein